MILQALQGYYERLKRDGAPDLEMEGFKRVEIPFLIVIRPDGSFVGIDDTRDGKGKGRPFFVPKIFEGSRTVNIEANLLWDKASYVFGVSPKAKPDRLLKQKDKFHEKIREYFPKPLAVKAVEAVLQFLNEHAGEIKFHPLWKDISESDPNLAFRLDGQTGVVTDADEVRAIIDGRDTGAENRICLMTGKQQPSVRLENPIKGLRGSGKAESHLVAFNEPAYWSYGKTDKIRYANAPISKAFSFAYVAAINYLQRKRPLLVGDATTVFWAEKEHTIESVFADLFGEPAKGEPEQDYKQLVATFRAPEMGAPPQLDPQTRFFVLGLAPNAARIAVRFWYAGTVGEMVQNIQLYFADIEIVRPTYEPHSLLPLNGLLAATGPKVRYDSKKSNQIYFRGGYYEVAPGLAGDTMKAILAGTPYPQTLLSAAVRRCRAEREITYPRAALIKGVLVRDNRFGTRFFSKHEKEVSMSLDLENTNIGYRLGRLFAVLEKVQEEANPGINATIRDRFYGSASATPVAAFPHLMKLKNHHLSKLENRGRAVNLEKMIGEIIDGIRDFPTHLSLADQGRFAVGYYHQRQAFFVK